MAEVGDWYVGPDRRAKVTWHYDTAQVKHLADKAVEREEVKTGKVLDEAEKERMWNLIKKACEGS